MYKCAFNKHVWQNSRTPRPGRTEPFVTLQCDQELRRISFEDYGSEITKITIHIYPPFPYRSMSCIKSMFQISCKCKIVNRRRTTTNYRQQVIWVTQVSQVNQSFYWIWYLMLMFVGWRTQLHWWWWWWWRWSSLSWWWPWWSWWWLNKTTCAFRN